MEFPESEKSSRIWAPFFSQFFWYIKHIFSTSYAKVMPLQSFFYFFAKKVKIHISKFLYQLDTKMKLHVKGFYFLKFLSFSFLVYRTEKAIHGGRHCVIGKKKYVAHPPPCATEMYNKEDCWIFWSVLTFLNFLDFLNFFKFFEFFWIFWNFRISFWNFWSFWKLWNLKTHVYNIYITYTHTRLKRIHMIYISIKTWVAQG